MKEKKLHFLLLVLIFGICWGKTALAQVSISGPACVTKGTTYMYPIQGKWDASASVKICVTGGILTDYGTTCTSGTQFSYAKIDWNKDAVKGEINITSKAGNASLAVNIISPLNAGSIDTLVKVQTIDSLKVPAAIHCNAAKGGSCSPSFIYQWQQSSNDMDWKNIEGGSLQDLVFKSAVKQNMFYRRQVIEKISGTINYSDDVMIIIIHQ